MNPMIPIYVALIKSGYDINLVPANLRSIIESEINKEDI